MRQQDPLDATPCGVSHPSRNPKGKPMRKILFILFAATLAVSATPANAARPARATLSATPSAPAVGDALVLSGCGYAPGAGVTVTVQSPSAVSFFGAPADASGCFSTAATETYVLIESGSYTVNAYQGRKAAASVGFSVS